jgi:hypothetical protein
MATIVNKLKGTLHLGPVDPAGVDMEAQISEVGAPQSVSRDSPVTVLTGDTVQSSATYSWELSGSMLLDLSDPAGIFYAVQGMQGTEQPFTFLPIGIDGPTISGICIVDGFSWPVQKAGSMATSTFAWPCQGPVTITPPAGP